MLVDARDGSDTGGGEVQLPGDFIVAYLDSLQLEQRGNQLQAVHHPVVDLLRHQLRPTKRGFLLDDDSGQVPEGTAGGEAKLHLIHHDGGEILELGDQLLTDRTGLAIDYAKRAEVEAVMCLEGDADIEAKPEVSGDQRMGERTDIPARVGQYPRVGLQDGRRAESGAAVDLLHVEPVMRLEPDAVLIDEANNRDRYGEEPRGNARHPVEGAVRGRVEDVVSAHRREALLFVDTLLRRQLERVDGCRHVTCWINRRYFAPSPQR